MLTIVLLLIVKTGFSPIYRMRHIHMVSTVQIFPRNVIHHNSNIAGGLSLKKINCTFHNKHISFDATDYADLPGRTLEQYDQVILHKRCFDPFEELRADRILTESEADEFILIGAPTEGAVRATTHDIRIVLTKTYEHD